LVGQDATFDVSYTVTDLAGNASADSPTAAVTLDTIVPASPAIRAMSNDYLRSSDVPAQLGDFVTSAAATVLSGTAEAGLSVEIFVGGISIGTVIADATGLWQSPSIDLSALAVGQSLSVTVQGTDLAGNKTSVSTQIITRERAVLDLTGLSETDGFIIQGDSAGDQAGRNVSSAGDVNGDGIDDLIVSAPYGDDGGADAGEAYVVFGKAGGGFGSTVGGRQVLDLTTLAPADGFVIQGDTAGDLAGSSVSSAGDVNGDGIDDLIVGALNGDDGGYSAGEAYVVFGKAGGGWGSTIGGRQVLDLTTLAPTDGFVIQGDTADDYAGNSVASAGDVNGDGIDDLIVGASSGDDGGTDAGEAYVVFGKASGGFGSTVGGRQVLDLTTLAPADGFIIQGDTANDRAGYSVSSAGDVNGDGIDDLIVGANSGDDGGTDAGEVYVVFGKAGGGFGSSVGGRQVLDLTTLAPADGFIIQGDTANDQAGYSVSSAGDVNGDGIDDLIVGAFLGADGGFNAGEAYVVFGKAGGGFGSTVGGRQVLDLTTFAPVDGFIIQGDTAGDQAGRSVSSAGDVNGDGIDDLIVGAPLGDDGASNAGEAYVVFGKADGGFGSTVGGRQVLDLTTLAPVDGFIIQGDTAGDNAGFNVSSAGDVNGDGFDDLIVGTLGGDDGGVNAGEAYVVFGRADFGHGYSAGITRVGTAGADWFAGSDLADNLNGGSGGADTLLGHAGDDQIAIARADFNRIDGGMGTDTLLIGGGGMHLDFTAIQPGSVTGIEKIDLNGTGANELTLRYEDVINMSDTNDTLFATGGADDQVNIIGFADSGMDQIVDGVSYDVYTASGTGGNATLLLEQQLATVVI
ncbi:hypothetical protein BTE77_34430, partial [Ensifer adhaerens]